MNHFQQILNDGQSINRNPQHDNEELYDKSTNQSNFISTTNETMNSPFDSSPKASMFFFSLNSPRQNADNFQFNNHFGHIRKNSKDHIQSISRRLQFQEDQSLFCQQQDQQSDEKTIKQEDQYSISSQDKPQKTKKIKKSKNSKGLKNLSIGVFEIVTQKGQTSYKEVANALIEKLKNKSKEEFNLQDGYEYVKKVDKDQHNIKRRVYDALNVLISAQLLRKQGKRVIYNSKNKKQKNQHKFSEEYSRIASKLQAQKIILQQKKQQLQKLKLKYQKINNIMLRNQKLGLNYSKVIRLPFIMAKCKSQNIKTISIGSKDVDIEFDGSVGIMGDIDTIQQIQKPSQYVANQMISNK